jgi:hypothetical protein
MGEQLAEVLHGVPPSILAADPELLWLAPEWLECSGESARGDRLAAPPHRPRAGLALVECPNNIPACELLGVYLPHELAQARKDQ